MLLERGQARDALAAFEAALVREPNRFNGLAGAAKAAEMLGDTGRAKAYYEKLLALASSSNANRPELTAARRFGGGH